MMMASTFSPSDGAAYNNVIDSATEATQSSDAPPADYDLIGVSNTSLLVTAVPLLFLLFVSHCMKLELEGSLAIASLRAFVQLSILGYILKPIFEHGVDSFWLIALYLFFMVSLAAHESYTRTRYYFDYMNVYILLTYVVNVIIIGTYTFTWIIPLTPAWDPHYVIPIVGMLLGNGISGVTLTMNSFLTNVIESSMEIELYLSFGASVGEATSRLVRDAIQTGTLPLINTMAVTGLISIPGMMTGQILGGAPALEAARYQIFILYLIVIFTFVTILAEIALMRRVVFNHRGVLCPERIHQRPSEKKSLYRTMQELCYALLRCYQRGYLRVQLEERSAGSDVDNVSIMSKLETGEQHRAPSMLSIATLHKGSNKEHLKVEGLSKTVFSQGAESARTLYTNLSFTLNKGDILSVCGPSGIGKTVLLRILGGLAKCDESTEMSLDGIPYNHVYHADTTQWRRQVRYVFQSKIQIPGSPRQFMRQVSSFKSWHIRGVPLQSELESATIHILQQWGMPASVLDEAWSTVSGGEAQRIYLAICLASRPSILLLDESTSALDYDTKLKVESTLRDVVLNKESSIVWITHDPDQITRMSSVDDPSSL
jgi:putative ABC transport system permease protein